MLLDTRLPENEKDVLLRLCRFYNEHGYAPCQKQLCTSWPGQKNWMRAVLGRLRSRGLVTWIPNCQHTLAITDEGLEVLDHIIMHRTAPWEDAVVTRYIGQDSREHLEFC